MLTLSLALFIGNADVLNITPAGPSSAWLLEAGGFGFLLEDGSSFWLIES